MAQGSPGSEKVPSLEVGVYSNQLRCLEQQLSLQL